MQNGKFVILCVDDDPDVLDFLQTVLESNGYLVRRAESAEEAKKYYQEVNPDALIIDLMMEEVDAGTELVRDLKALGATAPVFMLSSAGDSLNLVTDYPAIGLSGVFQKPVSPETLLNVLKAKLSR